MSAEYLVAWLAGGAMHAPLLAADPFWQRASLIALTFGSPVAIVTFILNLRTNRAENLRQKKLHALSFSLRSNAGMQLAAARTNERVNPDGYSGVLSTERLEELAGAHADFRQDIKAILNHYENLALSIFEDIADENTAYKMFSSGVLRYTHQFSNHIAQVRSRNAPHSYKQLERLARRWHPRKLRELRQDRVKPLPDWMS